MDLRSKEPSVSTGTDCNKDIAFWFQVRGSGFRVSILTFWASRFGVEVWVLGFEVYCWVEFTLLGGMLGGCKPGKGSPATRQLLAKDE